MQIVVSTAGIRSEVVECQCCQQDVLRGLWGISAMASVFWGWTQRLCGRSRDTPWSHLHLSLRKSQGTDLVLNKTILVWGLQYPAWDICWSPKCWDWPQQFRAYRSLLLSEAHTPSSVCWDLQPIWQLFSHSFHICASHWYWTKMQYGQLVSSENTPITHVLKWTSNFPTSNKEADT